MFTNVAIVAQSGPELRSIRNQLRNPVRYTVREFLSLEDVNHGLKSFPFDVLVVRVPRFSAVQVSIVHKMRMRFPNAGLVTIAPEIEPSARYQVKDIARHKLLHGPMEIEDLPKVVEKFVHGEVTGARMHPRVQRTGDCELVQTESGERFKCKFLDFAQMGARLLLHPRTPLRKNARYQLHYKSTSDPDRVHRIESSVVWAAINSGMVGTIVHGPQQMVGIRFIAAV